MKYLYLVSQAKNNNYDTYSDMVVCADSEQEARETHPSGRVWKNDRWEHENQGKDYHSDRTWADIKDVSAALVGIAREELDKGVVCASFHVRT